MITIAVPAGKYVVAVSGGVDSMVLLDMLAKRSDLTLVVAHFEHGIRPDSDRDRQLVQKVSQRYELPFVYEHGQLGPQASEADARQARYDFLRRVMREQQAQAIITAHHQDDLLETIIINIMRGTGRKGLSSLGSADDMLRPLLDLPKSAIRDYVRTYPDVIWHEDSTNSDDRYLRNYIRRAIIPKLDAAAQAQLLAYAARAGQANPYIDAMLAADIAAHSSADGVDRGWFIGLPYNVSCEVMAAWLRQQGVREFNRGIIQHLVVCAKTAHPGKRRDVNAEYWLEASKATFRLIPRTSS